MVTKVPPMSAAERQRKCRAGGKGRHRGGLPKHRVLAMKHEMAEMMRALLAAPDEPTGPQPADPQAIAGDPAGAAQPAAGATAA